MILTTELPLKSNILYKYSISFEQNVSEDSFSFNEIFVIANKTKLFFLQKLKILFILFSITTKAQYYLTTSDFFAKYLYFFN